MKLTKSQLKEMIREELKLTEASDGKWVVWVAEDAYGKNQKLMKVAKSRRAALIYYNKLVNSDKYDELGMESAEHWNRTNKPKVEEGKLNENYNKVWNNWVSALDNFEKATVNLAKYNSKVTADKVDERIILQNFKKYINPFYNLMKSWKKGKN